eukprot:304091-Amphidinium_carterae.1
MSAGHGVVEHRLHTILPRQKFIPDVHDGAPDGSSSSLDFVLVSLCSYSLHCSLQLRQFSRSIVGFKGWWRPLPLVLESCVMRLYATGDLARWRDTGVLDFLGRADFQAQPTSLRYRALQCPR